MGEGIVTLANMKISSVDGTAFVDFGATGVLTDNVGRLLKIYDSARRAITGRIYQAGSVETLDAELMTGWTNGGNPYETFTSVGINITSAIETGVEGLANTNNITVVAGRLYKLATNITKNSGQNPYFYIRKADGSGWELGDNFVLALGGANKYCCTTVSGAGHYIRAANNAASDWLGTFSYKRVLTPGSTGVLIVSEDMVTRNWTSKNSAFNYADSLGYTYDFEQEPSRARRSRYIFTRHGVRR